MKRLRNLKSCRVLAWTAVLFGAMVATFPLSAYGQQEVDPTWFDPWTSPTTTAVQPAQPVVQHHPKVKSVSASKHVAKSGGKRSTNRPKSS
jgi:hypothetical protein